MAEVTVIKHPLVQHKLSIMRNKETSTAKFRQLMKEVGMLLGYEVTRDFPLAYEDIETPMCSMKAPVLEGKKTVLIPVLRAGMGLMEGILELIPSARIGHIGLYREPETHVAVEYYYKVPQDIQDRHALVIDPMLATGHSSVAAIQRIKMSNPRSIKFICLLAAPEGIKYFQNEHPDIPIFTAAIDEKLNDHGYILPGLGDAGDRLFGTK